MYETRRDGTTYLTSGNRVYEVTPRGNLRLHHVITPAPRLPWWRRALAWLRRLLGRLNARAQA